MLIKRTVDKIFNDKKYFAATLIIIFSLSVLAFYLPASVQEEDRWIDDSIQTFNLSSVYSVVWSPDGTKLASASSDQTIKILDVSSGNVINTLLGHESIVLSVAWSPDFRKVI